MGKCESLRKSSTFYPARPTTDSNSLPDNLGSLLKGHLIDKNVRNVALSCSQSCDQVVSCQREGLEDSGEVSVFLKILTFVKSRFYSAHSWQRASVQSAGFPTSASYAPVAQNIGLFNRLRTPILRRMSWSQAGA